MTPPPMPTMTMTFILATGGIWLLYEIYVLYTGKQTISEGMYWLAKRPIVPFLIGVLMGHFYW